MATAKQVNLAHLEWAIQSRARNQRTSLRLLNLFHGHEDIWKLTKHSRAAQELTGAAFSLWRAAFLAERTGKRVDVFAHAKGFLERVIEDNAISYPSDKNSREWTFNYYTRAARFSLESLHKTFPSLAPAYVTSTMKATERWDYCQELLDHAIANFEADLSARKTKAERPRNGPSKTLSKHAKREKVREMTLAGRPSAKSKAETSAKTPHKAAKAK